MDISPDGEKDFSSFIRKEVINAQNALNELLLPHNMATIECITERLAQLFASGHKVMVCGNGGSLCDALHFAEELTGRFRDNRPPLPAMAIADPAHMSCVANDFGFGHVYGRWVEAFGKPGDLLFVLSTSGNSQNLIEAVEVAQRKGMEVVAFLGKGGGQLLDVADYQFLVESSPMSERIQEVHMTALHLIVDRVEQLLYTHAS